MSIDCEVNRCMIWADETDAKPHSLHSSCTYLYNIAKSTDKHILQAKFHVNWLRSQLRMISFDNKQSSIFDILTGSAYISFKLQTQPCISFHSTTVSLLPAWACVKVGCIFQKLSMMFNLIEISIKGDVTWLRVINCVHSSELSSTSGFNYSWLISEKEAAFLAGQLVIDFIS